VKPHARADGQPLPDPSLGFTKRCEVLRSSKWAHVFHCLDPRIRNAASHNGVEYDHDRGRVPFSEVDGEGNCVGHFEMTYVVASDKVRELQQGLIPGLLNASSADGSFRRLHQAAVAGGQS
jgi:hypothetical protein